MNGTWNTYSGKKHLEMYQMLLDSLEIIEKPLKVTGLKALSLLWVMEYLADPINTIFAVAIILDLIEIDYDYIKFKILEEKVCCDDERQRDELQQLQSLLEDNPLRFYILGDIRVTSSFSFSSVNSLYWSINKAMMVAYVKESDSKHKTLSFKFSDLKCIHVLSEAHVMHFPCSYLARVRFTSDKMLALSFELAWFGV
ncbi:hypothetical protein HW555_000977 [Spodoptera exigua]|uniref:Uncharacterized protein n=1 Tax=Spodoptera exigua TaxID=7107 RepID=A0A835GQN9_SPOEX|nr:hypothetical protein HW555_000977 [Spodoptera exigua]